MLNTKKISIPTTLVTSIVTFGALLLSSATEVQATSLFRVLYKDTIGPQWEGIVDTRANTLTIETWIETPGSIEFWTPTHLPLVLPAQTASGEPFDVPDDWDGTTGNNWGFISETSNFDLNWNEGFPEPFFNRAFLGWGGTFQPSGNEIKFFHSPFDEKGVRFHTIQHSQTQASSSVPDSVIITPILPSVNPVDLTTVTSGILAGVNVTTTGFSFPSSTSPSVQQRSFVGLPFSAAPISSDVDTIYNYLSTDDWTLTFDSPLPDLFLYGSSWRGSTSVHNVDPPTSYTFNLPFTILSGFNDATVNGNTLTLPDNGSVYAGILGFSGPLTTLSVVSEGSSGGQVLTFATTAVPATDVPEPSTLLGLATVLGCGTLLKRGNTKKQNKS